MTATQPGMLHARDTRVAALTSLIAEISGQVSRLALQGGMRTPALSAIAEGLATVLELLRETETDLATQSDDLAVTLGALERARQRYHDLFELAPDAYLVTDADGRILEANQAAIRLLGQSRASAYGRTLLSFVAPDAVEDVAARVQVPNTATNEPIECDIPLRIRGRNSRRLVRARVRRFTASTLAQTQMLWLLRRVSLDAEGGRRSADDPSPDEDTATQWLRAVLQTVPDATLLIGADGRIRAGNAAAARLLGPATGQAFDAVLSALTHPDDRLRMTRALLRKGRPATRNNVTRFRLRPGDGTWRMVEATITRIPTQLAMPGVLLSLRDITDRSRVEHAFERFYAYRGVAEALDTDAAPAQDAGTLLQRVAELAVPALGGRCQIFLEDQDGTMRLMATAQRQPPAGQPEADGPPSERPAIVGRLDQIMAALNDGEPVVLSDGDATGSQASRRPAMLALPLTTASGRTIGALTLEAEGRVRRYGEEDLILGRDLARQISLQIERVQLTRQARPFDAVARALVREQGDALVDAARNLRASLQTLHTSLIGADESARDATLDRVAEAIAASGHMERITGAMLDYLDDTDAAFAHQRQPVDLPALVQQVIAERPAQEPERPIQVFTHGRIPMVMAQPERLRQALSRVISYIDQPTDLHTPIHLRITATHTILALTVARAGRSESLPHHEDGSLSPDGVLLPVQQIVDAHGGTLACASYGDEGRSVTITLPIGTEHQREQPRGSVAERRSRGGRVSHREREVLGLLEQGLTNRQIAEHLYLSERTVEHHISRMLARFRLTTRTHLAAFALKHGLTGVESPEGG